MDRHDISEQQLYRLSNTIANYLGLDFPEKRWDNLQQGIFAYHKESDFQNLTETVEDFLISPTKSKIEKLAKHLTINETYFFRDHDFYYALEKFIIPQMIELKSFNNQQVKIWSAGCCTGEEPYSVAMLLDKMIPKLSQLDLQILASDINPDYLKKLKDGIYSSWSFRDKALEYRKKYFTQTLDGRYRIFDRVRNLITPFQLNLAENVYPSVQYLTGNSDIIICRNVLMYFTPEKAQEVIQRFYHSLADDGWLIVSSVETSQEQFSVFKPVQLPGVLAYQKKAEQQFPSQVTQNKEISSGKAMSELSESSNTTANSHTNDCHKETSRQPNPASHPKESAKHEESAEYYANAAREIADKGELGKAQNLCEKAISRDVLNPAYHYLLGTILEEQKNYKSALAVMNKVIYLDRNFILAHVLAGNISHRLGLEENAHKYYRNSLNLLQQCKPEAVLSEDKGMTANELRKIIRRKTVPSL